ncbi:hypothetical protein A2276_00555 [candidate division WOR-1 bacterium RIFOXYA12_FULL_43_27]|uniref:Uncharacterized protein n=1 Tax=candidate division WOR-1 bacterium RIFOXYC2_FULL_46_14 TaxID=1802587 RepID=A0A1F4U4U8_UNCSA|nr:MAG: hypothetical protein A2276_00555 [candidate division WOR-1 bacterium RIFOXYA12_FULL_43_27]OGC20818.1 MAG: hypothetical protein A2292_07320 [candidate division WOR-1 bacterium RIFOXYB2_FULL_46_45]OGC31445.1 MAG: hypothetical protein A2232_04130 [candidate division WOR-1 bacterium RIFOXYA2_FULL_46_56]OGC39850.1 MAG: hypothetical protein A2438_04965 [candidate division WOR-1 bacterium RIFOXYC2_FULL_46_14]
MRGVELSPELAKLVPDAANFICAALKKQGVVFSLEGKLVPAELLPDFLRSKGLSPQQQGAIALHLYSSIDSGLLPLPTNHGAPVVVKESAKQLAANSTANAKFVLGLKRAADKKNPTALLENKPSTPGVHPNTVRHPAYSDPLRQLAQTKKTAGAKRDEAPSSETRVASLGKLLQGAGIDPKITSGAIKELTILGKRYA